jgi:uncharacterized protein YndB with AHSA1/START domain
MSELASTVSIDDHDEDYQVQVDINAPADVIFEALTTIDGLAAWWTTVKGSGLTGGELTFSFGPEARAVMHVDAADRRGSVHWTPVTCVVEDWVGTTVHFDFKEKVPGTTELRFRHAGLTARLECFDDCKNGWDHFIPSLRAYVETGTGNPNQSEADLARREERAWRRDTSTAG